MPDATTVWLFRAALAQAGLVKALFDRFNRHLDAKGYFARRGQIVDATIVRAPKQHNSREENEASICPGCRAQWARATVC